LLYEDMLEHINSPEEKKNNPTKSDFFITFLHLCYSLCKGADFLCEWMCTDGKRQDDTWQCPVLFSSTTPKHYKYNCINACKVQFEVLSITLLFMPGKTLQGSW